MRKDDLFTTSLALGKTFEKPALLLLINILAVESKSSKTQPWDYQINTTTIEVKFDRRANEGNFFIEYQQITPMSPQPKPSGIFASEATWLCLVKPLSGDFEFMFFNREEVVEIIPSLAIRSVPTRKELNKEGYQSWGMIVPCATLAEYAKFTVVLPKATVECLNSLQNL